MYCRTELYPMIDASTTQHALDVLPVVDHGSGARARAWEARRCTVTGWEGEYTVLVSPLCASASFWNPAPPRLAQRQDKQARSSNTASEWTSPLSRPPSLLPVSQQRKTLSQSPPATLVQHQRLSMMRSRTAQFGLVRSRTRWSGASELAARQRSHCKPAWAGWPWWRHLKFSTVLQCSRLM
eukprot:SAG22_NODE_5950_length_926_cov_2.101572_1_plen_182_part_00